MLTREYNNITKHGRGLFTYKHLHSCVTRTQNETRFRTNPLKYMYPPCVRPSHELLFWMPQQPGHLSKGLLNRFIHWRLNTPKMVCYANILILQVDGPHNG